MLLACSPTSSVPDDPFLGVWRVDNDATLERATAEKKSQNAIALIDGMHEDDRIQLTPDTFADYSASEPSERKATPYRVVRQEGDCRVVAFAVEPPVEGRLCVVDGRLHLVAPAGLGDIVMVYRRE